MDHKPARNQKLQTITSECPMVCWRCGSRGFYTDPDDLAVLICFTCGRDQRQYTHGVPADIRATVQSESRMRLREPRPPKTVRYRYY
jgi:hypothetical protein